MATHMFEFINPRYLLGISDEPKQLLEPIAGYAYEPLLPLEEACEPLLTIVARLPAHIWIAKQNSKNPADGLTQDESAAIRLYTMEWDTSPDEPRGSLYAHLNRTLKEVDRMKLRPWFRYLKLFLTALAKLPCAPRQTVWRGVRKDHSDDYPPGTKVTWWAFSSCTTSLSVLQSDLYLGNVGTRTLFSIETINGRTIRSHSHFTTEDEILLLPGTYFEVKSRLNPAPDLFIIHLQQKAPPHPLLEPPFEGAELLPHSEIEQSTHRSIQADVFRNIDSRRWYMKNRLRFGIAAVLVAIVAAVILGAVLGTRTKTEIKTSTATNTLTTTLVSVLYNGSAPAPISVANAFYAFDENTLDLYSLRNGIVVGGPVSYIQGYIAYGQAIVLSQSNVTQVNIQPTFNLNIDSSFTIEGYFMLQETQLNAILIQLTPNIVLNLTNGILTASLGSKQLVLGSSVIATYYWHQFSFVYDATQQIATIYIDGTVEATNSSIQLQVSSTNTNSSIVIGSGYQGCIDQLAISLTAKSQPVILWDATTVAYYRLDVLYLQDSGPNGINATAANVIPIYGWKYNALNFNNSNSYFQASGFTALGTPNHAFSLNLWVRAESQAGVFLTVANPYTCLLIMGFQPDGNRLVVYLPNATATGADVNIIGPQMPSFAWVNVAFTWSTQNRARLYTSTYLQGSNSDASTLNNARGGNNSLPMTVTLGQYSGTANCQGIQGINGAQKFMGSIDEFFVFARELQASDLQMLVQPLPS